MCSGLAGCMARGEKIYGRNHESNLNHTPKPFYAISCSVDGVCAKGIYTRLARGCRQKTTIGCIVRVCQELYGVEQQQHRHTIFSTHEPLSFEVN